MSTIVIETFIAASPERCFDMARDVTLHTASAGRTRERAVAGVTAGLIGLGQTVTFEAIHFGIRQRLTARVTRFEPPQRFVDEMVQGVFVSFGHVHEFEPAHGGTLMRDTLTWQSPCGLLGSLADFLFLKRYLAWFIRERGLHLKRVAESAA